MAAIVRKSPARRRKRTATMKKRKSIGRRRAFRSSAGGIDPASIALAFAAGGAAVLAVGAASKLVKPHLGSMGDFAGAIAAGGVAILAQKFLANPVYRYAAMGGAGVSVVAAIAAKYVPQLVDTLDNAVNPDVMLAGDGEIILDMSSLPAPTSGLIELAGSNASPLSGASNSSPLG